MAGGNVTPALGPLFAAAGNQYHIPPQVLAGVASVETGLGSNRSTSSTGAQGLMQFEPGTAKGLGVNPYNDRSSVFGAAKLLTQYGYHQNPLRAIGAYNGGPGNPQYGYANLVMSESKRLAPQMNHYLNAALGARPNMKQVAQQRAAGGYSQPGTPGTPATSRSTTSGGQIDWGSAAADALLAQSSRPISTSGKLPADNLLGSMMNAVGTGAYTTPLQHNTVRTLATPGTPGFSVGPGPKSLTNHPAAVGAHGKPGSYTNPFAHAQGLVKERIDMGQDFSVTPGSRLDSIANSKVVNILPNWYAGRPFIQFKFLDGPRAGQYWYAAEDIAPSVHVGQTVAAGQQIGTRIAGSSGMEWGFGSGQLGQTLAQAQGNTGDGSHNNAPQGVKFAQFLKGLKGF